MTCIDTSTFKTVDKLSVRTDILHDDIDFGIQELFHNDFYQRFYHGVDFLSSDDIFKYES